MRADLPPPLDANDPSWFKDAIIYQLHVRAFQDSNGDGIGDFRGLIERLDYVQDLGVTALWLLPFFPSPLRDDGYDTSDYTAVHPAYGTLDDFRAFLREAHARGLRVITEMVLNHTSDQHPWFQRARRSPPGSPERDFYVWSDTPERYRDARIIFKDFEASNWTWDPVAGAYFWHRFYSHQPDLNYDNPAVADAMLGMVDFWFEMGVDGLRLDAIPYLFEREGTICENLPETHAYLKRLRAHVDAKFPGRMLLAEANQWPEDAAAYFGSGDECHMAFHFPLMPRLYMALEREDRFPILDILAQTPAIPDNCQWAIFLRNHDELTLEMVTDEERDYMYRVFAGDPQARINLGIRRRLAPLLENHRGRIELLSGLLLSLPGTPVLYYGDEIGMGDNIYLGDRHGVRTPMQWNPDRNAGFSRANPQRLYSPVIIDPAYHYESINVETQQHNRDSLLWWTKQHLAQRHRFRALGRGTLEFLHPDNPHVLVFVRAFEDERVLVVANLSRLPQWIELDLSAFRGMVPVEVTGGTQFPPVGPSPYRLTLGSYALHWFHLVPAAPPAAIGPERVSVPGTWENLFHARGLTQLEGALGRYLDRCTWLAQRDQPVRAATLRHRLILGEGDQASAACLVQVEAADGEPRTCLIPMAFAAGTEGESLEAEHPAQVLLRLTVRRPGERASGVVYDALGGRSFPLACLAEMKHRVLPAEPDEAPAALSPLPQETTDAVFALGERRFLRAFRYVEPGPHPEVEVLNALERVGFTHAPRLLATMEINPEPAAGPITLAVLGEVPSAGNRAWTLITDALGRFSERVLAHHEAAGPLPAPEATLLDLAALPPPPLVREVIGSELEIAELLGRRVAELHAALASVRDDPAFAPEPYTAGDQRSLYQAVRTRCRRLFEQLRTRMESLPAHVIPLAREVADQEKVVLRRLRAVLEARLLSWKVRVHGMLGLDRLLWTGKDFVFLGTGGDPRRTFSDRRRKRPAFRDLAGLLLSFDRAAWHAGQAGTVREADRPALQPWLELWRVWMKAALLRGYLEAGGSAGWLPQEHERAVLLDYSVLRRTLAALEDEMARPAGYLEGLLRALRASGEVPAATPAGH